MNKKKTGTILDYQSYADFDGESEVAQGEDGPGPVRGAPAKHSGAVQWLGPWVEPSDGMSEHVRRSACCLHDAGELVQLTNNSFAYSVDSAVELQVKHLLDIDVNSYRLRVIQMVPTERYVSSFVTHRALPPEALEIRNKNTVLYVVTEYEGITPTMAQLMSRAAMVWTASQRSMEMLARGGVPKSKLAVVPIPYKSTDPLLTLQGRKRKPGRPRFLHVGKWEPRKAQHEIIGAFLLAFKAGEAELLMKTSKFAPRYEGYPMDVAASARLWLSEERVAANGWDAETILPCLKVIQGTVPVEQLRGMHAWADVYVTLSHGEGFDMPAFDAKVAGNRLIYTCSGGPEDFAAPSDIRVPHEGRESAHPWYGWGPEAEWTKSTAEGAVAAFREAASRVGEPSEAVSADFSWSAVGSRMRQLLSKVEERR